MRGDMRNIIDDHGAGSMIDVEKRIESIIEELREYKRSAFQSDELYIQNMYTAMASCEKLARELGRERDALQAKLARVVRMIGDACSESMHERAKSIAEGEG